MAAQQTWPGWENVRLLGRGAFGEVYEIQRDVFGNIEKAALKIISIPKTSSDIEELKSDGYDMQSIRQRYREYLEDIVREYSLMATMKGNSNIVDCDDLHYEKTEDEIGWNIYIKMELLTPLSKSLPENIPEELVINLAHDMCNALVLCKNRNIVHRDIKPQNIFVSADGIYKLGDFGIAKVSEKTSGGTKTGTFRYMAPEVYNNQPYGFSVDIYSLGIVLYWLLNEKRTPFLPLPPTVPTTMDEEEAIRRRLSGEDVPLPKNGSMGLRKIVCKACAADPEKRYKSASEMLADLDALKANPGFVPTDDSEQKAVGGELNEDGTVRVNSANGSHSNANNGYSPEENIPVCVYGPPPVTSGKSKLSVILAIVFVLIAAGVIAAVLLLGGNSSDEDTDETEYTSSPASYPTEREMMSDAKSLLKNEDIDGFISKISISSSEENEKYKTYTTECRLTVTYDGRNKKFDATLIYEQNDGEWVFSEDLSSIDY